MQITLLILCTLVGIFWTIIVVKATRGLACLKWLEPGSRVPAVRPSLTVVIPARNEQRGVEASVRTILAQDDIDLELIVVDDHSTDSTGEILDRLALTDSRMQVIHSPELKQGWLGKPNAMQNGANIAKGEYLLFSDADIIHTPGSFSTAIAEMQVNKYDFIALLPYVEWQGFWENVILPAAYLVIARYGSKKLEDPASPDAQATGAFLMIRKSAYQELGGHTQIKSAVMDDIEFAHLIKRNGYRVGIRLAPHCVKVRPFVSGREVFWGMTKNLLGAFGNYSFAALPLGLMFLIVFWTGVVSLVAGLLTHNPTVAIAGGLLYTYIYASMWVARRVSSFKPFFLLFYPLASFLLMGSLMIASFYKMFKGEVLWRGRRVALDIAHHNYFRPAIEFIRKKSA
jgi:chlorobactene glucosyltransferase